MALLDGRSRLTLVLGVVAMTGLCLFVWNAGWKPGGSRGGTRFFHDGAGESQYPADYDGAAEAKLHGQRPNLEAVREASASASRALKQSSDQADREVNMVKGVTCPPPPKQQPQQQRNTAGGDGGKGDDGSCEWLERSLADVHEKRGERRCGPGHDKHAVTLVTGYYRMRSKHSVDSYMEWVKLFLLRLHTPTVVYTNCQTVRGAPQIGEILRERQRLIPQRTHVRFLDLEHTDFARQFGPVFHTQESKDPELGVGHNYWLYLVWLLKMESLMDAVRADVFCSRWFVWSDIGALRSANHKYKNWPAVSRLDTVPQDRVLMGVISGFASGDQSKWADAPTDSSQWLRSGRHNLIDADHIIGTFIAFSMESNIHYEFYARLRETYKRLAAANHLIVKDQTVYNALFLLHRDLFALVPSRGASGDDQWRYVQHWLASADERFKQDPLTELLLPKAV
eukprot:scpid68408/ scgid16590/ 